MPKHTPVEDYDDINDNLTAKPKGNPSENPLDGDPEMGASEMEYGEASLQDAKEAGYTDKNGKAVSMAKKDVEGHPTGAYTDIGAGRSSVVKTRDDLH